MNLDTKIEDAHDFYRKVVRPKCTSFLDHSGNLADAIYACMGLYHMREWASANQGHSKDDSYKYWEKIKGECSALEHARNIINSAKHVELKNGKTVVLERTREEQSDTANDTVRMVPYIISELPDGTKYDVREIVKLGMQFWDEEIKKLPIAVAPKNEQVSW